MNPPNNYSPEFFYPSTPMSDPHGGYPSTAAGASSTEYNSGMMMGAPGSNSPMLYNPIAYPPASNPYAYGSSFNTSSPIPTPLQNHPSNSTSSSNRSSLYGFTPSPYSNSLNFPSNLSNPSSYSFKQPSMFGLGPGHSASRTFPPQHPQQSGILPSPSPSFMNHNNGPSPWRMNDCLPSDILNPRNDYAGFSPNMMPANSALSNRMMEDEILKQVESSAPQTSRPESLVLHDKKRERAVSPDGNPRHRNSVSADRIPNSGPGPREHFCDQDYAEILERDAPLENKNGPSQGYIERNGRSILHYILAKEEIKAKSITVPTSLVLEGISKIGAAIFEMKHLINLYATKSIFTDVSSDIKNMVNLETLDLSNNKLTSLPASISSLPKLKRLYLADNQLQDIPLEFGRMYQLEVLDLTGNPLKSEIAAIYGEGEEEGKNALLSHFLDKSVDNAMLPERQWLEVACNATKHNLPTFSLLCYNILADNYATPSAHGQCPTWALNWKYRSNFIFKELQHYSPDIFALQELQDEQYSTVFKGYFEQKGYASTFYPKTRSTTMLEKERRIVDGCALFWRTSKFELESESTVNYNQIASNFGKIMRHDPSTNEFLNRIMPRDNVALIVTLKPKSEAFGSYPSFAQQQSITIANTHLHWDPEYSDVKIVQSMLLVRELKRILTEKSEKTGINIAEFPLLILGDFNSLPNSAVYEYLANNRVSRLHPELKGFCRYDISFIAGRSDEHFYYNSLNMTSAVIPQHMPYTNFTATFKGCIDYIFVTKASLQTLKFLGPFNEMAIRRYSMNGFPNDRVPSDHIPIMGNFAMMTVDDNLKLKIAKPQPAEKQILDITSATTPSSSSSQMRATNVLGFNSNENVMGNNNIKENSNHA